LADTNKKKLLTRSSHIMNITGRTMDIWIKVEMYVTAAESLFRNQ